MGATFVIGLREGIEAALIVSILLAYLTRIGRANEGRRVWVGVAIAIVLSVAAGAVLFTIGAEFDGTAEQLFEGIVTLTAVGVLTWMIFWMRRQGGRIRGELQVKVDAALAVGGGALALLAFTAVLREGIETSLFIFAAAQGTAAPGGGIAEQIVGAVLGLGVAVVLGVLLYRGGIRMDLRTFFRVTGMVVVVVAAGLFAAGLHELQEAGLLPFLTGTAFNVSSTLPDDAGLGGILRALIGYSAAPTWLEVFGWVGYLVVIGGLFLRRPRVSNPAAEPAAAVAGDARSIAADA
ncbi:MAG: iron uptake transporter permease EfeU [Actinomycetota bacterium]